MCISVYICKYKNIYVNVHADILKPRAKRPVCAGLLSAIREGPAPRRPEELQGRHLFGWEGGRGFGVSV